MRSEDATRKERVYWRMFRETGAPRVTEEDLAYFRDHPDEIDEVTAPVNVHKLFLWAGALIGIALIGILPLSRRMTRGLHAVTESAERGDRRTPRTRHVEILDERERRDEHGRHRHRQRARRR